jgi:hypothetical protein
VLTNDSADVTNNLDAIARPPVLTIPGHSRDRRSIGRLRLERSLDLEELGQVDA